ncbi:hypothetical protein FSW04_21860 [Baekduia soli]|uniref:Uncharacterized protein n=1 Tax=Baekduia soli TaxID=496014 RepID=A0A5B8U9T3_9ACTN|nr:DUF5763 domain-containing protein [Baekduia soli]QEC49949.1 hypothetical protein FSW04_21860 [Baekduia soli]
MYQFSRAMYRELARDVDTSGHPEAQQHVLHACEQNIERLVGDRHYFARPARTLFNDIRVFFPMAAQTRVWLVVQRYVSCAEAWLDRLPQNGVDVHGRPLQCRATTRRGTPCQRMPLTHNGYCPSHQHLAETEELRVGEPLAA